MIGPISACFHAHADSLQSVSGSPDGVSALQREKTLFKKMFNLFLACVLTLSLAPSAAWAEDGERASADGALSGFAAADPAAASNHGGGGANVSEDGASSGDPSTSESGSGGGVSGDASGQGSSADLGAGASQAGASQSDASQSDASQVDAGQSGAEENAGFAPDSDNRAGLDSEEGLAGGSSDDSVAPSAPLAPSATPDVEASASDANAMHVRAASALDSDGCIWIEKSMGSGWGYESDQVKGDVQAGTTLWANHYDYDEYCVDAAFTYQWYSGATKSVKLADYAPIDGATSQSLTIDSDFAKAHDGEYLLVQVSDGKTTLTGPTSTYYLAQVAGTVKVASVDFTNGGVQYLMGGSTLEARVYPSTAEPTYTWEKSTSKTGPFEVIDGATDATLELTEDLVGHFLRVTATTSSTSKQKTTGYAVAPRGSWLIDEVRLTDTIGAYAGTTLTAQAYGRNAENVSKIAIGKDDAVFTWQYADSDGYGATWSDIPGASGRGLDSYTVDEAYAGKYIRVRADANIESWVKASSAFGPIKAIPRLASIDLAANGKAIDYAVAGDAVAATVLDEDGRAVADNLTYTWESSSSEDGPFAPIAGAAGASYAVPEDAAGSYVRLTAAGIGEGNAVERTFAIHAPDSLEAVANALIGYVPVPNSDEDTSLAVMIEKKIADLGFEGVSVSLASTSDENIVAADGVITGWYYADPSSVGKGDQRYSSAVVSFSLSKDGDSIAFVPGGNGEVKIGWDRARVRDAIAHDIQPQVELADYLNKVDTGLDEMTKFTQDLPTSAGWANVSWESSDESLVEITEDPYALVNQLERKKLAEDAPVTITAVFAPAFADADGSLVTSEKSFDCIVKKFIDVSGLTSNDLKMLLEKSYTIGKLTDFATGEPIDPAAVDGDVQLPIPRDLFVEAHELSVSVASSDENVVKVNGYRAYVYRPIDGQDCDVTLTVTLARKDKATVKASITIDLTVRALDLADIDAEIALMEDVKASYADGIKGENTSIGSITKNMESFQEVYRDEATGDLVWVRDRADTADHGIVPDELDGWYDSQMWRCFRSSDASIVSHENLLVSQPAYNTEVTVASVLTSEEYGKYYELYKDDPSVSDELKAKLASLYRQPVSHTFTVLGASGQDDPAGDKDTLNVSASITGATGHDADGSYLPETWVPRSRVTVEKGQNITAWDCFARLLDENGFDYATGSGLNPYSITTPEGRTLTTVRQGSVKNSYWAFFINGVYADVGTRAYEVRDGDLVELRYLDSTGSYEADPDAVDADPNAAHPDLESAWSGHANGGSGAVVENVETPVGAVESKSHSLLTEAERRAGAEAFASDPLIIGGMLYIVSGSKTIDPNTGKARWGKARLSVIDPATNNAVDTVELATTMDTTCRPAYADGIIVIPLSGGYLQALSAATRNTMWVTVPTQGSQSVSTLTIADGCVYASTVDELSSGDDRATKGTLYCYDLYTGDRIGKAVNESAGYYWTGGVKVGDYFIVPDDAGNVTAYTADLKQQVSSVHVDAAGIRSSLIVDGDTIYAVSKGGVLYRLVLRDAGASARSVGEDFAVQLVQAGEGLRFAQSSTSTPTIGNGMLFVGGLADDGTGSLSVIGLDEWSVLSTISGLTATSGSTDPSVQCAPLVSVRDDGTYVYFTSNRKPGGVYLYKVGDETWREFFVPDEGSQDYCISSIVCGPDGTLYYTNDSGTLFALRSASGDSGDPKPTDPAEPTVPNGSGGNQGGSGNESGAIGFNALLEAGAALPFGSSFSGEPADKEKPVGPASEKNPTNGTTTVEGGTDERADEATFPDSGLNWLAVVGVAVGLAVLGGVLVYSLWPRRRQMLR